MLYCWSSLFIFSFKSWRDRRVPDCTVIGFTTTCTTSAYHH